ncbi:hypothetical protein [Candidatus Hepatoplasma crinochetorum]|jgi:hypothetical protein|uniref:Uncharacterized protein n=1 Tax=Candidatus Hepatoplasma crinochetorum Av TaxID=1427984 RepID=W8GF04_9MOLU|nr:hypothetical protein [Candidatus Hepatoplasma crinochetorum]AHK22183.1 hypothetical protein X271_00067 [Candidatus Hepatoplasma crinochetorum Av]BDV02769.1 MAG: hypothetical protein HCTKY_0630 [Candidatus Hepatoplasma crinochetorum]
MNKKRFIRKIIINLLILSFFILSWSYFFIFIKKEDSYNEKPIIEINNLNKSIIIEDPFIDYEYFEELWINDFNQYDLLFEPSIYFGYYNNYIYVKILNDNQIIFKYKYCLINNKLF